MTASADRLRALWIRFFRSLSSASYLRGGYRSSLPLHDGNCVFRQAVQFINQPVNLPLPSGRVLNIRISEYDLTHLKRKAEEEGMPYQTLISSVLHKYITDRLVDEKEIIKSLQLWERR